MFSVIFVLGLLYHTYTDLKSMLLYDKTTLILAAVGLVRAWYERQLFDAAYGAGISSGAFGGRDFLPRVDAVFCQPRRYGRGRC